MDSYPKALSFAAGKGKRLPTRTVGSLLQRLRVLLLQALRDGDSHRDGRADHRVVAHAEEAHHLHVRGHGGGAGELSVGMHTAHGVGHAVGSGTGGHVVGVQGAARAAAGGDGEILLALLDALFLIGAGDGMLEAGRVGGVAGDNQRKAHHLKNSSAHHRTA